MEFWREVSQKSPSLSHLDTIGTEYETCVRNAEMSFQAMLQMNPTSVPILRSYAQFLLEVRHVQCVDGVEFVRRHYVCSHWLCTGMMSP